jgi:hypothetical protein
MGISIGNLWKILHSGNIYRPPVCRCYREETSLKQGFSEKTLRVSHINTIYQRDVKTNKHIYSM